MLRIASVTDHHWTPSSRFRVRQYGVLLRSHGVELSDFPREYSIEAFARASLFNQSRLRSAPSKWFGAAQALKRDISHTNLRLTHAKTYNLAWVTRELVNNIPPHMFKLPPHYIYDLDDALFISRPKSYFIEYLTRNATTVTAGNSFIADILSEWNKNVCVIPPGIDTSKYIALENVVISDYFNVGWIGTSSSYNYLKLHAKVLSNFLDRHSKARLHICSDKFPDFLGHLGEQLKYTEWSQSKEVDVMRSFNVGIMPLSDDLWSRGKCSYKMLQYMACGIPVCVTAVGMNNEVASLGKVGITCRSPADWVDALEYLLDLHTRGDRYYADGPLVIKTHFDLQIISAKIANRIKSLGF